MQSFSCFETWRQTTNSYFISFQAKQCNKDTVKSLLVIIREGVPLADVDLILQPVFITSESLLETTTNEPFVQNTRNKTCECAQQTRRFWILIESTIANIQTKQSHISGICGLTCGYLVYSCFWPFWSNNCSFRNDLIGDFKRPKVGALKFGWHLFQQKKTKKSSLSLDL